MNFWYMTGDEGFYDEEDFLQTKRWKRCVQTLRNQMADSLGPAAFRNMEKFYATGLHHLNYLEDHGLQCHHFLHYLYQSVKDSKPIDTVQGYFTIWYFGYWATPWDQLTGEPGKLWNNGNPDSGESSQIIREDYLRLADENFVQFQNWIESSFASACYARLLSLCAQDSSINSENYFLKTKEIRGDEDGSLLLTTTMHFLQGEMDEYRVRYHLEETLNLYQSGVLSDYQHKIQKLEQENKALKQSLEDSEGTISALKLQIKESDELVARRIGQVRRDYKERLSEAKKRQNQLKEQLSELSGPEEKPEPGQVPTADLPETEPGSLPQDVPVTVDHSRNYAFVIDGDGAVLSRLKQEFPKAQFLTGTSRPQDLNVQTTELVVFVVRFTHHSTIYKYKNICLEHQIPFLYFEDTNIQRLDGLIAEVLPEAVLPEKEPEEQEAS